MQPTPTTLDADITLSSSLQSLVAASLITLHEATAAQQAANSHVGNMTSSHHSASVAWLVDEANIDAHAISKILATNFYCQEWSAIEFPVNPELLDQHRAVILATHAVPLRLHNRELLLAVADPCAEAVFEQFSRSAAAVIVPVVINYHDLADILQTHLGLKTSSHRITQTLDIAQHISGNEPIGQAVELVDEYLNMAVQRHASDIHFEPFRQHLRIRMRIDGVLHTVAELPISAAKSLVTRLKVLSKLDIAEHRLPQDGRLLWQPEQATPGHHSDMRISFCPVLEGEKAVVRILANAATRLQMSQLGMSAAQLTAYESACAKAQGLILVTGPTGSGKSVTQYAALTSLNDSQRNISTAEDPVEILLDGVNQVHVNPKIGLTFAAAMRAFLRQDPDVIMIGEIRDYDTAEMAVKAAQTGHLVFSTLHTNDAPQSLTRLENIGVAPHNIAASVSLIIAQRLIRKLCTHCRLPDARHHPELATSSHPSNTIYRAKPEGCRHCDDGYQGRTGVFQVLPISDAMRDIMLQRHDSASIGAQAEREGIDNLMITGLQLVASGITSRDELDRVLIQ